MLTVPRAASSPFGPCPEEGGPVRESGNQILHSFHPSSIKGWGWGGERDDSLIPLLKCHLDEHTLYLCDLNKALSRNQRMLGMTSGLISLPPSHEARQCHGTLPRLTDTDGYTGVVRRVVSMPVTISCLSYLILIPLASHTTFMHMNQQQQQPYNSTS